MLFLWTVEWSPDRLSLEETHGLDEIGLVTSETMVDSLGKSHQISLLDVDTNPLVIGVTNIEKAGSVKNVTDFFGIVNMLFKESLDLGVKTGQVVWVDGDDIGIRVAAIVTKLGQAWIESILGVPWDSLDGVSVGIRIHLPVVDSKLAHASSIDLGIGILTIFFLLIINLVIITHQPSFGPFFIRGLGEGSLGFLVGVVTHDGIVVSFACLLEDRVAL
mmetsp:Transcript_22955/g.56559  ORF Transcript_22955/g.56559 Transcript_22955/m.56559 type:complete len:218 (-) Transcript_22955:51-704(-)